MPSKSVTRLPASACVRSALYSPPSAIRCGWGLFTSASSLVNARTAFPLLHAAGSFQLTNFQILNVLRHNQISEELSDMVYQSSFIAFLIDLADFESV